MATNADIAKAAGVSPAIVSRIVNGDSTLRVSQATRERVLRLIEELDYSPNVAARTLKAASTGVIALVVHDLTNSVYAEIITGAQEAALMHDKTVLVGEANEQAAGRSHLEELVAGRGIDGVILQGAGTRFDRTLERAARHGVPTVLLQAGDPARNVVVQLDDEAAGRVATQHLIDLGHRQIGYVGVDSTLLFSRGRLVGWRHALTAAGIDPDPRWVFDGGNKFDTGGNAVRKLVSAHPELTALVVANVAASIGVLASLHDMGRSVPDDVSMVAIHDIPLADHLRPALTVVRMPLRALGSRAMDLVCADNMMQAPALVRVEEEAPRLIQRGTTAPPMPAKSF